jgi:hypothetical protein
LANWKSTGEWKEIELDIARSIIGSTQVFEVSRPYWPSWAHSSTQMNRLWIYEPSSSIGKQVPSSDIHIVAHLITERVDPHDKKPLNFNLYLIAESTDGRHYQSPPLRTTDPVHHSTGVPKWLEDCDPPPI